MWGACASSRFNIVDVLREAGIIIMPIKKFL